MDNLSGYGVLVEDTTEYGKWNWGAFWLTWIWGFFNETFISLLVFVPIVNLYVPFYLGKKGYELAWRNKRWIDHASFLKSQKKWNIAGWISSVFIIGAIVLIIYNIVGLKTQEEYLMDEVYQIIYEHEEASAFVGKDFQIVDYRRGSMFYFLDTTYSMVLESAKGKYWVAVRLDEDGKVEEVLVSHYYVIPGFKEVIIEL